MCEFKGPVTRFGFVIRGAHFLCSVHSARPPEKVDLLRACNIKSGTQLETVLDGTSDVELPTRIIRTFIREHGATQQVRGCKERSDELRRGLYGVFVLFANTTLRKV